MTILMLYAAAISIFAAGYVIGHSKGMASEARYQEEHFQGLIDRAVQKELEGLEKDLSEELSKDMKQ